MGLTRRCDLGQRRDGIGRLPWILLNREGAAPVARCKGGLGREGQYDTGAGSLELASKFGLQQGKVTVGPNCIP